MTFKHHEQLSPEEGFLKRDALTLAKAQATWDESLFLSTITPYLEDKQKATAIIQRVIADALSSLAEAKASDFILDRQPSLRGEWERIFRELMEDPSRLVPDLDARIEAIEDIERP